MTIHIDLTTPAGFDALADFVERKATEFDHAAAAARRRAIRDAGHDGPCDIGIDGRCRLDDCPHYTPDRVDEWGDP